MNVMVSYDIYLNFGDFFRILNLLVGINPISYDSFDLILDLDLHLKSNI